MNLILLGPPGSGKGTIANFITSWTNIDQISTGDILRAEIRRDTELGKIAKSYMNKGNLVPDDLVIEIVSNYFESNTFENGFLLDGFPRTIPQAKALDDILDREELELNAVVFIDISEDEIINRINSRITCSNPKCQEIYNQEYHLPQTQGICDNCGSNLQIREDQAPDIIRRRIEVYRFQTEPLIEFYSEKELLHTFKDKDSKTIAKELMSNFEK